MKNSPEYAGDKGADLLPTIPFLRAVQLGNHLCLSGSEKPPGPQPLLDCGVPRLCLGNDPLIKVTPIFSFLSLMLWEQINEEGETEEQSTHKGTEMQSSDFNSTNIY